MFHQSYDTYGTERILINLATNGCQNAPIDSNPPTPTPTFIPSVTPTNPATPTPPPASVFSNAQFTYNGDGQRVKSVITTNLGTTTTYFVGAHYEVANGVVTKYYYAGAQRIAMRSNDTLYFMLGDHLGSTSLVTFANGNVVSETRYREASPRDKAWGEVRHQSGVMPTKYQYTGQYSYQSDFGLLFYNARWYDSYLNHFTQPDTIVPDPSNSLDWNRYSYTRYNPVKNTDPSGHAVTTDTNEAGCNTPGSPKCILDKYSGASTSSQWLQDLELYYYQVAYPEYDVNADSYLEGPAKAIVAAPKSRGGCVSGSWWDCFALAAISTLGSWGIGPTGAGGSTSLNNNSVPANLANDVYSSGGWVSGAQPNPWAGQPVVLTTTTETTIYRVWSNPARRIGNWFSPIRPITRDEAIANFSLPWANKATTGTPVTLPAGTQIKIGQAGPMFGQPGGYTQIQVLGPVDVSWFGSDIVLPVKLLP